MSNKILRIIALIAAVIVTAILLYEHIVLHKEMSNWDTYVGVTAAIIIFCKE